jgi:opacity protein-like surface antigen
MFEASRSQVTLIGRGRSFIRVLARAARLAALSAGAALFVLSGAEAQNCQALGSAAPNGAGVVAASSAVAANLAAVIAAANTAFLTQSTAFVGAPVNPQADQPGGGVWTRAVGGQVDISSTSTNIVATQGGGVPAFKAILPCSTTVRSKFDGVQIGADFARLNWSGWNVHLGMTAGSLYNDNTVLGGTTVLQSDGTTIQAPFSSTVQVPFIGAYLVATNGDFFADAFIRTDAYQANFTSPANNLWGQNANAHGLSVGGSLGYHYEIPNSGGFFVEPSAGFLYSRVRVDDINMTGAPTGFSPFFEHPRTLNGTLVFDDITEAIGRLGLRVGTSFTYGSVSLQPFAAVSVWRDFAGSTTANWTSCPGCLVISGGQASPGQPLVLGVATNAYTGTNFGTYGQYSLGISGALANTGWLGYARVDYRDGENLKGWDVTGGVRYQFNPENIARAAFPVKAMPVKAPGVQAVAWDGLYVGGIGGAEQGRARWGHPGGSPDPDIAGILGGVQAGYNWQRGPWVFGLEGEWNWTDAKGGVGCGQLLVNLNTQIVAPLWQMTCNARQSWVASITPRVGFAWDRSLFYLKGGIAFTREEFTATCNFGANNGINLGLAQQVCAPAFPTSVSSISNGFSASDVRAGGTVGFGVQFALTQNWSTRAEIDYVDFGRRTLTASDGTPINVGIRSWQAKIGVDYRLEWPG